MSILNIQAYLYLVHIKWFIMILCKQILIQYAICLAYILFSDKNVSFIWKRDIDLIYSTLQCKNKWRFELTNEAGQ